MVVFTCNHCGDSVQKPKAEKHYETKCRNNYPNLCCVDCLKDFRGDEFRAHTSCVTEAERYGGKGFVAKPNQNKGEKKQNAWIEIVQAVLDDNKKLHGSLRYLLERISKQPNTPRKKPKFMNFIRSMDRKVTMKDIEAAWDLLASKLDKLSALSGKPQNGNIENNNNEKEPASIKTVNVKMNANKKEVEGNDLEEKDEKNNKNNKEEENSLIVENETHKIKEKSKKKKDKTMEENCSDDVNSNGVNSYNGNANEVCTNNNPLTKKELKKKKKREKYEMQLAELQKSQEQSNENSPESKTKQSSKRKHNEDTDVAEKTEEPETKTKKSMKRRNNEDTPEEPEANPKKSVKRKHNEDTNVTDKIEEPNVKKPKKDSVKEYDWTSAILSVLGVKGKYISLKKLQKRVVSQYCADNNVENVSERILKKFCKSLYKVPNVKVENDKVFLCEKEN